MAIITNIGILDSAELADLDADFSDNSYAVAPDAPAPDCEDAEEL